MNLTPEDVLILVKQIVIAYHSYLDNDYDRAVERGDRKTQVECLLNLKQATPVLRHVMTIKSLSQLTDEDLTIVVHGINDRDVVNFALDLVGEEDSTSTPTLADIPDKQLIPFVQKRMIGYIENLKEIDKETGTSEQEDITNI